MVEKWTVKDVPVRLVTMANKCLDRELRRIRAGLGCMDDAGRVSRDRLRSVPLPSPSLSKPIQVQNTQQVKNDILGDEESKKTG